MKGYQTASELFNLVIILTKCILINPKILDLKVLFPDLVNPSKMRYIR